MLTGVPSFAIDQVWHDVKPLVQRCLDKAKEHRYLVEDYELMIRSNDAQLWVQGYPEIDAVVITRIAVYPRAKELVVLLVCGKLHDDWLNTLAALVESSRKMGCTHASAYVRKGFVRLIPDWEPRETYIVKEL